MKVLQTMGKHAGSQVGVFQYKRTADGVWIDSRISTATTTPFTVCISHEDWNRLLNAIFSSRNKTFALTSAGNIDGQTDSQNIYELISTIRGDLNDSVKAAICAILEHEGTIDHYHGPVGGGVTVRLVVIRDDQALTPT